MSNTIHRESDNAIIGYASDIAKELKDLIADYTNNNQWEEVQDMAELLLDLQAHADSTSLLIVSDHNGMGYSIDEYHA